MTEHKTTANKIFKAVFPGKYMQAENALTELPGLIRLFGKNGLILASATAKNKILPGHESILNADGIITEAFSGECCESELKRIADVIRAHNAGVLVGMGGGKAIDTAKIAADRAGIPVIIVPTIASTDAPCSGCAVIYTDKGEFSSVYYQKLNPQAVLVDTRVIVNAPVRFLIAGMGDALATWFEARSCQQAGSPNECGGYSTLTGLNLAYLCYDTLLRHGEAAIKACEQKIINRNLNYIIEANILLSGIGFESSGLATAHSVHNGLTALQETHAFYHGEKVAFGVVTGLHLTAAPEEETDTVYGFCEKTGLPTTLSDIGLKDVSRERLMQVAVKACAPAEGIHHEPFSVTPENVLNAIIAADEMGRKRKSGA